MTLEIIKSKAEVVAQGEVQVEVQAVVVAVKAVDMVEVQAKVEGTTIVVEMQVERTRQAILHQALQIMPHPTLQVMLRQALQIMLHPTLQIKLR